jgi:dihydroxyacetone kinase-like protein
MITMAVAKEILQTISDLMAENRDYLIDLDSQMGDGDLGLTMTAAFSAAADQMKESTETDMGKFLAKTGMVIAKAAPSTMGTLMATGFMRGGKAVVGAEALDSKGLVTFFEAFTNGLIERGKTKPGEKTVLDVFSPVVGGMNQKSNEEISDLLKSAVTAAYKGVEDSKAMKAQHGRAAYYQEKSIGQQDPGATAGAIIIKGFLLGYTQD